MLSPRLIPCLLLRDSGLVKTAKFTDAKYVGDPLNAVRIFNEKQVDELMVLDIDASKKMKEPNYDLISSLATESRMPLCYGGGVKNVQQFRRIINLGVEKVSISSGVFDDGELVRKAVDQIGSQSVVVVLDVKKKLLGSGYNIYTHGGSIRRSESLQEIVGYLLDSGVGELVINSIDRDGTMRGYDFDLLDLLSSLIDIPLTCLGGAGSLDDVKKLVQRYGHIGAGAGSLFVFKGKYKAVLISYPSQELKDDILNV